MISEIIRQAKIKKPKGRLVVKCMHQVPTFTLLPMVKTSLLIVIMYHFRFFQNEELLTFNTLNEYI